MASRLRPWRALAPQLDAASLRVLRAKEDAGLLDPRITPTGRFSPYLVGRVQAWLGTPQTRTWDAATIRSLQYRVGAATTGRWDAASVGALQDYLGIARSGSKGWDSRTVTQLQRYLTTQL